MICKTCGIEAGSITLIGGGVYCRKCVNKALKEVEYSGVTISFAEECSHKHFFQKNNHFLFFKQSIVFCLDCKEFIISKWSIK